MTHESTAVSVDSQEPGISAAASDADRRRKVVEFIKFCAVGGSGVGVNLGIYALLTRGLGLAPALASPIAIEISLLSNFLWNERWTFALRTLRSAWPARLGTYHAVCLVGGGINYIMLLVLIEHGWWDIAANLAGIALGTGAKFVASTRWTWREHR